MGHTPTLSAGVIALITLFALEGIISRLCRWRAVDAVVNNRPIVLMAGEHPVTAHLTRYHVSDSELRTALRLAGITAFDQVAAVVLEPTGTMSVLRRAEPLDRRMLVGVRGADLLPGHLLAPGR